MSDPDLTSTITTAAGTPASASSDGQSASARPIADLIAAQQFLDAKTSLAKRRRGVLFTKLVSPGPIDDQGGTQPVGNGPFGGGLY